MKSLREIMSESGIDGLRIVFRFQLSFIDANQLLSFAGFFAETIVSNPVKPGRKTRFATKAAEILVGAQESLLRKIIRERNIGPDQLAEKTPHGRLMISDQLREGVVVVIDKNAGDKVCIG